MTPSVPMYDNPSHDNPLFVENPLYGEYGEGYDGPETVNSTDLSEETDA